MLRKKTPQIWQPTRSIKNFMRSIGKLSFAVVVVVAVATGPSVAQAVAQDNDWDFGVGIYGWGAFIGGESATGNDIDVDLNDIIDNLNFTFMGVVEASKGEWSFTTDILYLDLEGDKDSNLSTPGGNISANTDVQLKSWIITPEIGYSVVESDNLTLNVIGGARYLSLDTDIELNGNTPSSLFYRKVSDSGSVWDAVVGVRGKYAFDARWYIPFYLDVGTGDSDFTWQGSAGIAYKFAACDVVLTYRYLEWQFDDNPVLNDLNINGPLLGVKFEF